MLKIPLGKFFLVFLGESRLYVALHFQLGGQKTYLLLQVVGLFSQMHQFLVICCGNIRKREVMVEAVRTGFRVGRGCCLSLLFAIELSDFLVEFFNFPGKHILSLLVLLQILLQVVQLLLVAILDFNAAELQILNEVLHANDTVLEHLALVGQLVVICLQLLVVDS